LRAIVGAISVTDVSSMWEEGNSIVYYDVMQYNYFGFIIVSIILLMFQGFLEAEATAFFVRRQRLFGKSSEAEYTL
jgi:hypothetical protein